MLTNNNNLQHFIDTKILSFNVMTWSPDTTHNLIRAIPQSYEFNSLHRRHHPQVSPKTSDRSALHLYLEPNSLYKRTQCNIFTKAPPRTMLKASPRTMLKTAPCTMLKMAPRTMLKLAPCTMLGVISYHRVLVDNDLAISTGRCWLCKDTSRCQLYKGYW